MGRPRFLRLEAGGHPGSVRFLAGLHVSLAEGRKTSIIRLICSGTFHDPRYGEFEITRQILQGMVRNFGMAPTARTSSSKSPTGVTRTSG